MSRYIYGSSNCLNCGNSFNMNKPEQKYCSRNCMGKHRSLQYKKLLDGELGIVSNSYTPATAKKFILKEQDYKCSICNNSNIWNNEPLIFILDHIDGNSTNNERTNLRLICPNCDTQLPTYKSKNRKSGRYYRRDRYKEGKSF